jgi:hypothetical protein
MFKRTGAETNTPKPRETTGYYEGLLKLTGDMFADMETRDEIHNLEMQLKGVKPLDSHFDCVGCGS